MGKLIAAYQNEMLKILRKKSIWIIGLIMVAVIALVSVGVFLQTELSGVSYDYDSEILWMEKALQSTKDEIGNKTGSDITDTAEGSELYSNLWRVEYLSEKIDYYKALDEKDIYLYNQYDYRAELLEAVFENAVDIAEYENIIHKYGLEDMLENGYYLYPYSGNYSEEYIAGLREINDKYTKIVAENDFAAYIEIKNAEILADDMYDENEKRIKIENNTLRLDGNITGEYLSHERIIDSLMELTEYKISVETGKDYVSSDFFGYATGEPLMPSKLEEYKKQIALIEYKFESGYYNINEDSDKTSVVDSTMFSEIVFSIGMTFMLILLVMLAGSIISVEMSNGSIKVLAVAPIERRKIFAAKCMALFTIAFAGCILRSKRGSFNTVCSVCIIVCTRSAHSACVLFCAGTYAFGSHKEYICCNRRIPWSKLYHGICIVGTQLRCGSALDKVHSDHKPFKTCVGSIPRRLIESDVGQFHELLRLY